MLVDSVVGILLLSVVGFLGSKITEKRKNLIWISMVFLMYNSFYQLFATVSYTLLYLIPPEDGSIFTSFIGEFKVLLFLLYAFVQLGGEIARFVAIRKTVGITNPIVYFIISSVSWLIPFSLNLLNIGILSYFQMSSTVELFQLLLVFLIWSLAMTYFGVEAIANTKFVLFAAICIYFLELILVAFVGDSTLSAAWPLQVLNMTIVVYLLIATHALSKYLSKRNSQIPTQS